MPAIRAIALALIALSAASCAREEKAALPDHLVELSDLYTGQFSLIDKNGAPKTNADFSGKVMLIYFGYTNCPDVCPTDIGIMSAALNELDDKEVTEIAPIFISVDPERDTPDMLRDYFAFDPRIIPLTGTPEAAAAARASFKLYAKKEEMPDSALGYAVQHQEAFFIADRKGEPRYAAIGRTTPEALAALLRRSVEEF